MTYPHDYQPGEHRAALGDMLRDMDAAEVHTVRRTCPACGAGVSFYAGCRAEPDTGVAETPAGDYCDDACGWSDVHQPRDEGRGVKPYWQSSCGRYVLYHGDCLEVLPTLEAGSVDAVVSDVPYGMGHDTDSKRFSGGQRIVGRGEGRDDWGMIANDDKPFDPAPWLAYKRVVLWGCNHFAQQLPVGTTLVWIKKADHLFGTFLSDCELAWMKGGHGVYAYRKQFPPPSRMAENDGTVAHPCQKPIGLLEWCIERAKVPDNGLVLDPFTGSGTTGVACVKTNRRFIGIEIEERYCEIAARRIEAEASHLFAEANL